jgi:hypothetical protein
VVESAIKPHLSAQTAQIKHIESQVIDLYRVVDLATPAFRAGSADKILCKTSD